MNKLAKSNAAFPVTVACGLLLTVLSGCSSQTTTSSIKAALGAPGTPLSPAEAAQIAAWNAQRNQVKQQMVAAHAAGRPISKISQPAP